MKLLIGASSSKIFHLEEFVKKLENANEMGVKGREFVKNNFNWDKICNDFLNHLKKHNIGDI